MKTIYHRESRQKRRGGAVYVQRLLSMTGKSEEVEGKKRGGPKGGGGGGGGDGGGGSARGT